MLTGPLESSHVPPSRIILSVPLVNAYIHPVSTGPIFASHPLDLQVFPVSPEQLADPFEPLAHTGPPTCNIEVKLGGVEDVAAESGADLIGLVMIRGPPVGKVMGNGEESYIEVPSPSDEEPWVSTAERGRVLTNGAFKILSRK